MIGSWPLPNCRLAARWGSLILSCASLAPLLGHAQTPGARPSQARPNSDWPAALVTLCREQPNLLKRDPATSPIWQRLSGQFPTEIDWFLQDGGHPLLPQLASGNSASLWTPLLERVLGELGGGADALRREQELLRAGPEDARPWLDLYLRACHQRRARRLQWLLANAPRIVFTKHYNLGGSHYAYTEGQSDAQDERHFQPWTHLCLLEMDGIFGQVRSLLDEPEGVIRDPDVSYDGRRVLFAWKKSDREDDYHLYEMDLATRQIRQITSGLGFADYEGIYLPNGDISSIPPAASKPSIAGGPR